jgi:hypothetical protein
MQFLALLATSLAGHYSWLGYSTLAGLAMRVLLNEANLMCLGQKVLRLSACALTAVATGSHESLPSPLCSGSNPRAEKVPRQLAERRSLRASIFGKRRFQRVFLL